MTSPSAPWRPGGRLLAVLVLLLVAVAGGLAGVSIRAIFAANAIVYLLMIGFVYRNVRH